MSVETLLLNGSALGVSFFLVIVATRLVELIVLTCADAYRSIRRRREQ